MGVLETIIVRKESYPVRKAYNDFYSLYGELNPATRYTSYEKLVEAKANFL